EILMQTIVVADAVSQEKRRRLRLSGFVTTREIGRVIARKSHIHSQSLVPAVGDVGERRGERGPPRPPPIPRRGIEKIVFSPAQTQPRHPQAASEKRHRRKEFTARGRAPSR